MCLLSTSIQEVSFQSEELDIVFGSLKVSYNDCSAMQENKMFALNQVAPCKISPENLYSTDNTLEVFQRSYRTYMNEVMCKVKTLLFVITADYGLTPPLFVT